jgi:hypothetical protein
MMRCGEITALPHSAQVVHVIVDAEFREHMRKHKIGLARFLSGVAE